MIYFSIIPTIFPEIIFAHQFAQKNYHYNFNATNHNIEIAYVKLGALIINIGNCELLAEEGSLLLLPHNCNFSIRSINDNMHVHYTLNLHVCNDITLYEDSAAIPHDDSKLILPVLFPPCTQTTESFNRLTQLIEEYHKTYPEGEYKCACKAFELLCDIAALCKSADIAKEMQYKCVTKIYNMRIKEYIQKNLSNPITLSDLSVFLEKSPNYLNRIFKAENDITIQQYINREKIKKCIDLITTEGLTLSQCCEYVGVKDPNYLSRLFKKHMGISVSNFKLNSVYSTFPLTNQDKI